MTGALVIVDGGAPATCLSTLGGTTAAAALTAAQSAIATAIPNIATTVPLTGSGAPGAVQAATSSLNLPSGTTATTQAGTDSSTKIATTAFAVGVGRVPGPPDGFQTGLFYAPGGALGVSLVSSYAPTAGRWYAPPVYVAAGSAPLASISVTFTGVPTAGYWSGCVYTDSAGRPASLVSGSDTGYQSNSTVASATTQTLTYITPVTWPAPGVYWIALNFASATGTYYGGGGSGSVTQGAVGIGQPTAAAAIYLSYAAVYSSTHTTYAVCPNTFGTAVAQTTYPIIALGF